MSENNVNLLYVVDKVIIKLEGRKGVLNLDFDDELVNEIRLEMADTIREAFAECQPQAPQGGSAVQIRDAAIAVLAYREGDLPTKGWLRDNDASRKALSELADATKEPK